MDFTSKYGAGTRNRTADLLITNQSLYQLSYPGLLPPTSSEARWGDEYNEGTTTYERELLNETQFVALSICGLIYGESIEMRDFSGIVDLPALLMVLGTVFVIALANGFSRRGSVVMAHGMLMEASLLFLLISLIPLFEDSLNFMALPYMASFALVTFALAGFVAIMLGVFLSLTETLPTPAKPKRIFRLAAIATTLLGVGYLATGNTSLGAYAQPNAVVFILVMLAFVGTGAWLTVKDAAIATLANQLPNIAILGLVIAISAAVLDVYELPALLPLLGFGLTVAFLTTLIRVILQLGGWAKVGLDGFRFVVTGLLITSSVVLVLVAQTLA